MNVHANCHITPGDRPRATRSAAGASYIEFDTRQLSALYLGRLSAAEAVVYLEQLAAESLRLARILADQPIDIIPVVVSS